MDSKHHLTLRSRFLAVAAIVGLASTAAHHAQAQTAEKWDPAIAKFEAQDKVAPPPQLMMVFPVAPEAPPMSFPVPIAARFVPQPIKTIP